jgi:predicted CxxxxCH...CXXCH cytochrome family protein
MCHNAAAAPHASGTSWLNAGAGFHGTDAKADLTYCQGCHGTPGTINFNGGSAPTACSASACHPAAKAHPTDWQGNRTINGVTITHRTSGNRDVACAICHKTTGTGVGPNPSAPSCFSANFTNDLGQARPCHSGGPGSAPHALDATWSDPAVGGSAFHGTEAKADLLVCQTCHGTPPRGFAGGAGATTACTDCHTTADAHPTDWQGVRAISTASITHRTAGNRVAACGICHNVAAAGTGPDPGAPSCFSDSYTNGAPGAVSRACHAGGPSAPNHPVPFFDNSAHTQATTFTFAGDCVTCHDATGSSTKSGPVCTTCHVSDPRNVTNCTSCHGNPPTGATTAYPNVAGAHAKHLALNNATTPGTPVACATCHTGLGTGTLSHYNRTRPPRTSPGSVAFVATIYNAKTGAAAFDNSSLLRCTNVSCHGGQAAPNWRTGTLTVNTQCSSCHVYGTAQYNGPTSSNHNRSEHRSQPCTNCHNTTTLAVNHFTKLNTTALEGPASATVGGGTTRVSYVPATRSCTPSGSGCHGRETW